MPTRIILVRHGQSTFNAAKRFQGCTDDSVLTASGRLAAYQTGLALNHIPFDAVYVSPLKRTQETAQEVLSAIAAVTNTTPPLHLHSDLREIDLPEWQGLSYADVRSRFAQQYQQWQDTPHLLQMKLPQPSATTNWANQKQPAIATLAPAETTFLPLHQLYAQARGFWQEILLKHSNQTLLVISHGGTNRALISTAIGLSIDHYHFLQQSNTGISELMFTPSQSSAQLQSLNLTQHLGECLPKLKNGKQGMRIVLLPVGDRATDITPLITQLQAISFECCITDASDRSQSVMSNLLTQHPNTGVPIQIQQPNFLLNWHQALHARMQSQKGLCTVLVVAQLASIQGFLQYLLALPDPTDAITLKPATFTVLYYPASARHPVLQSMNSGTDAIAAY